MAAETGYLVLLIQAAAAALVVLAGLVLADQEL